MDANDDAESSREVERFERRIMSGWELPSPPGMAEGAGGAESIPTAALITVVLRARVPVDHARTATRNGAVSCRPLKTHERRRPA